MVAARFCITDIRMPQMGGEELAAWLWTVYPELKVLFVSGCVSEEFLQAQSLRPQSTFVEKPFKPTLLARKVVEMLDTP